MTKYLTTPSGRKLTPTAVYDSYWRFAVRRQDIYFARLSGKHGPWTDDSILLDYKFTNAFRAADRVSQFLISQVIYNPAAPSAPAEVLFRILLFKLFNRIETWRALSEVFGMPTWQAFDPIAYGDVLDSLKANGQQVYSAAYIIPPVPPGEGRSKHTGHLGLIASMMEGGFAAKVDKCRSLGDLYQLLLSYPSLGPFLAFQIAIDINYSEVTDFAESSFVVAGPGARDGIAKCFVERDNTSPEDVIAMMVDRQEAEFARLRLSFRDLFGRSLQPIDCQNLFCEISKYARVAHPEIAGVSDRTRIKQKFRPVGPLGRPFFPPKWGINDVVEAQASTWPAVDARGSGSTMNDRVPAAQIGNLFRVD